MTMDLTATEQIIKPGQIRLKETNLLSQVSRLEHE